MSNDPKDNVIKFPGGQKRSIANLHVQEYKSKGHHSLGMRTKLISDLITEHNQEIGALQYNQYVKVIDVDVDGNNAIVDIELFEKDMN